MVEYEHQRLLDPKSKTDQVAYAAIEGGTYQLGCRPLAPIRIYNNGLIFDDYLQRETDGRVSTRELDEHGWKHLLGLVEGTRLGRFKHTPT